LVEEGTATINRLHELLSEFGVVQALKAQTVCPEAGDTLDGLLGYAQRAMGDLLSHLHFLDDRVGEYDVLIREAARADARSKRPMEMPGIGLTTASTLLASIGNRHDFKAGRQFAMWLGLTPGQYSSGGKARLGEITKAGDADLRTLLILGTRAVLASAKEKTDRISRWAMCVAERRSYWRAVVAVAAKNAHMAWAMLAKSKSFVPIA